MERLTTEPEDAAVIEGWHKGVGGDPVVIGFLLYETTVDILQVDEQHLNRPYLTRVELPPGRHWIVWRNSSASYPLLYGQVYKLGALLDLAPRTTYRVAALPGCAAPLAIGKGTMRVGRERLRIEVTAPDALVQVIEVDVLCGLGQTCTPQSQDFASSKHIKELEEVVHCVPYPGSQYGFWGFE